MVLQAEDVKRFALSGLESPPRCPLCKREENVGNVRDAPIFQNAETQELVIVLDEDSSCGISGKQMLRYKSVKGSQGIRVVPRDYFYGVIELENGKKVRRFKKYDFSEKVNAINAKAQQEMMKNTTVCHD